ncbi:pancreatic secretory granule membrane major glycoprotein GP2 [Garra rufa]|uniref:pancreatic secretory granule membrane major glycoprotein GP2 n=1 Tax=Garra rufa TaxID=137080 RepID=UPI003CCEEABA
MKFLVVDILVLLLLLNQRNSNLASGKTDNNPQPSVQDPQCPAVLDNLDMMIGRATVSVLVMRPAYKMATAVLTTIRHAVNACVQDPPCAAVLEKIIGRATMSVLVMRPAYNMDTAVLTTIRHAVNGVQSKFRDFFTINNIPINSIYSIILTVTKLFISHVTAFCDTCTENEVCLRKGGVYGCGCLHRQNPNSEIFDAVESCASSNGSMSLSRCQLFDSGFRPENLHLNDPSCKGTLENGRLVFHFDNEDYRCGTTLTSNGTHFIYQNSIQHTPTNTDQYVITRESWMNITFSCVYPLIQTLSMPMGVQVEGGVISQELPAGQGTYQIRIIPYHDAEFTSPYDGEVEMQVNQQMYVAVEVEGVDRNQIAIVLDNCWATPVNDIDYHPRWNLIIRECPNPADGTVEVLRNGVDTKGHFSFRMFTFSGISDHIFLHCQVHLCLVQNGRCAHSCDHGFRSRRRRSLDFHHSAAITMGLMKGHSNPDK